MQASNALRHNRQKKANTTRIRRPATASHGKTKKKNQQEDAFV